MSISHCLYTSSNRLRSQAADILAALCVLSLIEGHRTVVSAFSDLRTGHDERFRFEYLVGSIRWEPEPGGDDHGIHQHKFKLDEEVDEEDAGTWEYRTAAMALINAITGSPADLEERVSLREEFARRGLNEVMAVSLSYP
jgi:diaphanous 1